MDNSFEELLDALDGLTDDEMNAFRVENWPRHNHWSGQDGSIRGILCHVAYWKEALALALETGADPDLAATGAPEPSAANVIAWLTRSHHRMIQALAPYQSGDRAWPGLKLLEGMDLEKSLEVWEDHDRYHRAQIVYLRTRYAALRYSSL